MTKGIPCVRDPVEPRIVYVCSTSTYSSSKMPDSSSVTSAQADILGKLDRLLSSHQELRDTIAKAVPSLTQHGSNVEYVVHDPVQDQAQHVSQTLVDGLRSPGVVASSSSHPAPLENQVDKDQQVQARSNLLDTTLPADHTTRWVSILDWPALRRITQPLMPTLRKWPDPLEQELGEAELSLEEPNGNIELEHLHPSLEQTPLDSDVVNETVKCNELDGLAVDQEAISRLTQTYLSRISTMHPIISPQQLDHLLASFVPIERDMTSFLLSLQSHDMEDGTQHITYPCFTPSQSIQATLLLLVLALGQACEHIQHDTQVVSIPSSARMGHELVPLPGSVFLRAATIFMSHDRSKWKLSLQEHVQANILAGLYHGQYSRVLESHAYYARASHSLYLALQPSRSALITMAAQHERVPTALNHLVILFWSCLQLERYVITTMRIASILMGISTATSSRSYMFHRRQYSHGSLRCRGLTSRSA